MLIGVFVWWWGYRHTLRTPLSNSVSTQTDHSIKWEEQRLHKMCVVLFSSLQRNLNWPDLSRWLHSWRLQSWWMNAAISSTKRRIANSYRNADGPAQHLYFHPRLSFSCSILLPFPGIPSFLSPSFPFPPTSYSLYHKPLFSIPLFAISLIFPSSSLWSGPVSCLWNVLCVCYKEYAPRSGR